MNDILAAALHLASRGLPVFPCRLVGVTKKPFRDSHGFKDATTDSEQITYWWRRYPRAGIAMPTGALSGIDVLDVDVKEEEGINGFDALPANWRDLSPVISRSPRGGAHIWFRASGSLRSTTSEIAPGIDTRGEGGFIVVPPSRRNDGKSYHFEVGGLDSLAALPLFPDHLRARMFKKVKVHRRPSPDDNPRAPHVMLIACALRVIPNPDLDYNQWNEIGMAIWASSGGSDEGLECFDLWSKKSSKYAKESSKYGKEVSPQDRWDGMTRSPPDRTGFGKLAAAASRADPEWLRPFDDWLEKQVYPKNRKPTPWSVIAEAIAMEGRV